MIERRTCEQALELILLQRVDAIRAQVDVAFPLYADPPNYEWMKSRRGSWMGGFWCGLLWLRAQWTQAGSDREAAEACLERLTYWLDQDTSARAMIFWYGAQLGASAFGDVRCSAVMAQAAHALAATFDVQHSLIPEGRAFERHPSAPARASVDALAAVTALLSSIPDFSGLARVNLDRHLQRCLATKPITTHFELEGEATGVHVAWERGRAWTLLACAQAAASFGPHYLVLAERLLDSEFATGLGWREAGSERHEPLSAANVFGARDSSAAAIAVVALLKLAAVAAPSASGPNLSAHSTRFRSSARELLSWLLAKRLRSDGVLEQGCYDEKRGIAVSSELIWGTFFLAWALALECGFLRGEEL